MMNEYATDMTPMGRKYSTMEINVKYTFFDGCEMIKPPV